MHIFLKHTMWFLAGMIFASIAVMGAGFPIFPAILMLAAWAGFFCLRLRHACHPCTALDRGLPSDTSHAKAAPITLPFLLQSAQRSDELMRESGPYYLYNKAALLFFVLVMLCVISASAAFLFVAASSVFPVFSVFFCLASLFGIIYTCVNVKDRLRRISEMGAALTFLITFSGLFMHQALAGSGAFNSDVISDFLLWAGFALLMMPCLASLLRIWLKFGDRRAALGLGLIALSFIGFYTSSGTLFQYPVILTSSMAVFAAWLEVLHRWRKRYRLYMI